jgi:hypothetical protein
MRITEKSTGKSLNFFERQIGAFGDNTKRNAS